MNGISTTQAWNSPPEPPSGGAGPSRFGLGLAPPGDDALVFLVLLGQRARQRHTVERAESYAADCCPRMFASRVAAAYRIVVNGRRQAPCLIRVAGTVPQEWNRELRAHLGPLARFPAVDGCDGDAAARACQAALAGVGEAAAGSPGPEAARLAQEAYRRARWFA